MAGTIERTLALKLIADVGGLNKGLGQAQRRIGGTARAVASWGKAFGGAALIGAFQGLVDVSVDGVKAFREEQDAVRNFNKTVKNMNSPVKRSTKALDKMADRAVDLGFDDGDTIRGMDAFLQQTGNIGRASQTMGLAFDIARSRQIPLTDAIKVAQNVYKGSSRELDKYGISGVKGMEAVDAARRKERGKAAEWARNHPAKVLLGRIADGWADVVGNLSQGRFGEALEAGQKLATNIVRGITGYTTKNGKRVRGLWDRLFDSSEGKDGKPRGIVNRLGEDIGNAIGSVDWGKTLSDTLSAAITGLQGFVSGPGAGQLALVGGAIAGAMFIGSLFIDAAKAIFSPSAWLGGLRGILGAVGAVLGWALRAGMFVASKFVDAAALTMGTLSRDKIVRGSARGLGGSIGGSVITGVIAGLTGAVAIGAVAQAITKLFTSAEADWTKRGPRPLPDSPFKWPWQEGGFFFPGHATGTAGSPGGWRWVGERGPELMRLSPGTQVMDSRRSMAVAGGTTILNVTLNVPYQTDAAAVGESYIRAIRAASGRDGGVGLRRALAGR